MHRTRCRPFNGNYRRLGRFNVKRPKPRASELRTYGNAPVFLTGWPFDSPGGGCIAPTRIECRSNFLVEVRGACRLTLEINQRTNSVASATQSPAADITRDATATARMCRWRFSAAEAPSS